MFVSYKPFAVSLQAFNKKLNSNSLRLQTRPQVIIRIAFVHRPEPAFPQKETAREILRYRAQLAELKVIQVRAKRLGQVLVDTNRRRATEVRKGHASERRDRGYIFGEFRLGWPATADIAEDRLVFGRAAICCEGSPWLRVRVLHFCWKQDERIEKRSGG